MTKALPQFGIVTIGNAIVDVLAMASEDFLTLQCERHGMARGAMTLIDASRAVELYEQMGPGTEMSGGSAGNTIACFASFGGRGAYIGKVGDDMLGTIFRHDLRSLGVAFDTPAVTSGAKTARCLILVSDGGERTMNTFLGACTELSPADIDEAVIADAAVTYMEGYLFDPPLAMEAFYKAAKIAHAADRKVALTLSDPFCVGRHRAAFRDLVENHVDILFCNEDEITSLYETNLEDAIEAVRHSCAITAITRGASGSVIITADDRHDVAACKVERVVDTTGAGDAYAAGFLHAFTENLGLAACGERGSLAAAEIISQIGPRPQRRLETLIDRQAA